MVRISSDTALPRAEGAVIASHSDQVGGDACPGLFYQTPAQDGFITRLRVPGGILRSAQANYIAQIAREQGQGQIWLTNRANVQLRTSAPALGADVFAQLQRLDLAAPLPEVDHVRNVMASPTAGIDPATVVDTREIVSAIDAYLSSHSEFAALSAKFSIGLDGGETVNVRDRRNDVWFIAESAAQFRIQFGLCDTGLVCSPARIVDVVAAICRVYAAYQLTVAQWVAANHCSPQQRRSRRIRWSDVVDWFAARGGHSVPPLNQLINVDRICEERSSNHADCVANMREGRDLPWRARTANHVGIHPQSEAGLFYAGIVVPLGQLRSTQFRQLSALAQNYGNGELRLTPWQNMIVPNIAAADLGAFQQGLAAIGLTSDHSHPATGIIACRGLPGCAASLTETQFDATQITQHLAQKLNFDRPINIHVSGCRKGCAQPYGSDIALMGTATGYDIYLRQGQQIFGRLLVAAIAPNRLLEVIEEIIVQYHRSREPDEAFSQFTQRYEIDRLREICGLGVS